MTDWQGSISEQSEEVAEINSEIFPSEKPELFSDWHQRSKTVTCKVPHILRDGLSILQSYYIQACHIPISVSHWWKKKTHNLNNFPCSNTGIIRN